MSRITQCMRIRSARLALIVVGALGLILIAAVGWQSIEGSAQTPADGVTAELNSLARSGHDPKSVVARVNGRAILFREVAGAVAFSGTDEPNRLTWDEALDDAVEHHLLVSAAEAAGITVTDEEIDMMVSASLHGYDAGLLSKDEEALLDAAFAAAGTTLSEARTSDDYRAALRNMLVAGRYLSASSRDRAEVMAELRSKATIEVLANEPE